MEKSNLVFEARDLTVFNKASRRIFSNFSFEVNAHEIWMVEGPNGIGKSSLYEAFVGIGPIENGAIIVNGTDVSKLRAEQRVRNGLKYIPQGNALFDDITVEDNLLIFAQSLLPKTEQKQAIEEAIETFELQSFIKKKPCELSGGMRRSVELSKILIGPAYFIMMDEPFAAIDEIKIAKMTKLFRQIAKNKRCSFFINDHRLDDVYNMSDYCIHLGQTTSIEKLDHTKPHSHA